MMSPTHLLFRHHCLAPPHLSNRVAGVHRELPRTISIQILHLLPCSPYRQRPQPRLTNPLIHPPRQLRNSSRTTPRKQLGAHHLSQPTPTTIVQAHRHTRAVSQVALATRFLVYIPLRFYHPRGKQGHRPHLFRSSSSKVSRAVVEIGRA